MKSLILPCIIFSTAGESTYDFAYVLEMVFRRSPCSMLPSIANIGRVPYLCVRSYDRNGVRYEEIIESRFGEQCPSSVYNFHWFVARECQLIWSDSDDIAVLTVPFMECQSSLIAEIYQHHIPLGNSA